MPAKLLALDDAPAIRVDKPILIVGRNADCDVVMDSKKISRQHCCIAQINDYLVVRDLGSTNGVRVNGQRITESKLFTGDELSIGNLRYRVQWEGGSSFGPGPQGRKMSDSQIEMLEEPVALVESGQSSPLGVPPESVESELDEGEDPPVDARPANALERSTGWLKVPEDVKLTPSSDLDIDLPLKPLEDA